MESARRGRFRTPTRWLDLGVHSHLVAPDLPFLGDPLELGYYWGCHIIVAILMKFADMVGSGDDLS